jgi:hypothetical protein
LIIASAIMRPRALFMKILPRCLLFGQDIIQI